MVWLLSSIIALSAVSDFFRVDFSLAPGLSLKNLLLYAAAGVLIVNAVILRSSQRPLGKVLLAIVVFNVYALLTWAFNSFIVKLDGYDLVGQGIALKSNLIDYFVFFLVYYYGVRGGRDAVIIAKAMLIAVGLANLFTVTQVAGLTGFGEVVYGNNDDYEGGRVHGAFGHANETAALIVLLLPFYVAAIETSRGLERAVWYGFLGSSLAMFLLTGSRGGIAALLFGTLAAAFFLRRYFPAPRVAFWAGLTGVVAVPALAVFGGSYFKMLMGRIQSQTLSGTGDVSSGRTELWLQGLSEMMSAPVSLLTGFGWGTWDLHGFPYVAHNQYLWTWFELGLVGLACYVVIWSFCLRTGLQGLRVAGTGDRAWLLAYVTGAMGIVVAMVFEDVYEPFLYIWPLLGTMVRYGVEVTGQARTLRAGNVQQDAVYAARRPAAPATARGRKQAVVTRRT